MPIEATHIYKQGKIESTFTLLGIKVQMQVDDKEYAAAQRFFESVILGTKWDNTKNNPMNRIQMYMKASTTGKFAAEGISPDGRKRWWKKWTPKYKEFRIRYMRQPTPIMRLAGSYSTKTGKTYSYNLRLIKSIRKEPPNAQGDILSTNVIYAHTHQYGDIQSSSSAGRGMVSDRNRRISKRESLEKGDIANTANTKTKGRGRAQSRKSGRFRNIPARPFFLFTNIDKRVIGFIFMDYWKSAFISKGVLSIKFRRVPQGE